MAAGLREMQENRGFSENRIDKFRFVKLHTRFLIQYTFERHPAQVFRMISGQRCQLFDCQIVIDSDHVPRIPHR